MLHCLNHIHAAICASQNMPDEGHHLEQDWKNRISHPKSSAPFFCESTSASFILTTCWMLSLMECSYSPGECDAMIICLSLQITSVPTAFFVLLTGFDEKVSQAELPSSET